MPESATELVVFDVAGLPLTLTPGLIDVDAELAFTRGHCAEIALALHARTGWDLYLLVDGACGPYAITDGGHRPAADRGEVLPMHLLANLWLHALVARPEDGMLLDITGYRTPDTVLAHWHGNENGNADLGYADLRARLVHATPEQVAALPSAAPAAPGIGQLFVDAALTAPAQPVLPWPWQHSLPPRIAELVTDIDDDVAAGNPHHDAVRDHLEAFDDETALLHEALTRQLLPAALRQAATELVSSPVPVGA